MAEPNNKPCPLPMPLLTVEEARSRHQTIRDFIFKFLEVGVDYGAWKGTTDPNASKAAQKKWMLYKSGTQKLTQAFDFRSRNRVTFREVSAARVLIESECDVLNGAGEIVATRTGICCTDEPRFDYLREGTETPNYPPVVHNVQAMAAKRAFVEALEAALAIGGIFAEEDDGDTPAQPKKGSGLGLPGGKKLGAAVQQADSAVEPGAKCQDCGSESPDLTQAVRQLSTRKYGIPLCHKHQKEHPQIQTAGAPAK